MNTQSIKILIVLAATLYSMAAFADGQQIYKWTDSQGVVHYSDKAPVKPVHSVQQITLPALPAPDPQSEAQNQAWIAGVNQWYESVLKQESQLQYEQLLAWQESQPKAAPVPPAEPVSYAAPLYGGYFRFRHRHHESDGDEFGRPPHPSGPMPRAFRSSLWNTQPNPFSQQLYKP